MNFALLNDGTKMPELGFGLWQVPDAEAEGVVTEAIKVGYRSIDSAQVYENEAGVGRAVKNCGCPREELFVTTKIWNSDHGYDSTLRSFDKSLERLGLEQVDLLLIHWPAPKKNLYVETWKALIEIKKNGGARSIGVSNFHQEHLTRILQETSIVPSINQIEIHPYFQQKALRDFHKEIGIQTESWSPLGQGHVLNDPVISEIAHAHNKSPAQVIIRWHLQNGLVAIPKTVTPSRMKENFNVFDFTLTDEDMQKIGKLDREEGRVGPNPDTATF